MDKSHWLFEPRVPPVVHVPFLVLLVMLLFVNAKLRHTMDQASNIIIEQEKTLDHYKALCDPAGGGR